jgi:hypothetical protein
MRNAECGKKEFGMWKEIRDNECGMRNAEKGKAHGAR